MILSLSLSLSLYIYIYIYTHTHTYIQTYTYSTLSQRVKTSAAGNSQQAQVFAVQEVLLLHDNAHPHSAVAAVEAIRWLKFELLPHLPYKRGFAYTNICR